MKKLLLKFPLICLLVLAGCSSTPKYDPTSFEDVEPDAVTFESFEDLLIALEYDEKQKKLINLGKRYLGAPYVYGGSSPVQGFDCSGFTQYIYKRALNKNLPRTTKQQFRVGKSVPPNALKPGDLIFFNLDSYLSHVGIYLGNGKFFHASTSKKKLIIADLKNSYFAKRYNSARRVLTNN